MKDFEEYFSDAEIIKLLCKYRIGLAKRRNDHLFFRNLNKNSKRKVNQEGELTGIFPPRKEWRRPKLIDRKGKSSTSINFSALYGCILKAKKLHDRPLWLVKLLSLVGEIREQALHWDSNANFSKPKIKSIIKDSKKNFYRPLCVYSLENKIVITLTAKYLRDAFDSILSVNSYAFRARRTDGSFPNHHEAAAGLRNFIVESRESGNNVYIAECDIQKFFDAVSHRVAADAFTTLKKNLEAENLEELDRRAELVFFKYLDSYNFRENVKESERSILTQGGSFPWLDQPVLDELYSCGIDSELIGVPQGGALSPLISNLVLHACDSAVERDNHGVMYVRYCDDMIIAGTDYKRVYNAFERYKRVVSKLKLPIHEPQRISEYGKEFFETKSKSVYRLDKPLRKRYVQWVSFLGYQVRYDGLFRIRKTSLAKELKKQVEVTDSVIDCMVKNGTLTHRSANSFLHRLANKLVSMSVGKVSLNQECRSSQDMCWVNGFKNLRVYDCVGKQIKALDRNRNRQISRMLKKIKALEIHKKKQKQNGSSSGKKKLPNYYGYPFSYWKAIRSMEG